MKSKVKFGSRRSPDKAYQQCEVFLAVEVRCKVRLPQESGQSLPVVEVGDGARLP